MVIKKKSWGAFMARMRIGLQGILYDHASDHLLVCDAENSRVVKMNPVTGNLTPCSSFIFTY